MVVVGVVSDKLGLLRYVNSVVNIGSVHRARTAWSLFAADSKENGNEVDRRRKFLHFCTCRI